MQGKWNSGGGGGQQGGSGGFRLNFSAVNKLNIYCPFHKTLSRSSVFVNWISVRFYEMNCNKDENKSIFAKL